MKWKWKVYLPFAENMFKSNLAYKGSFYLFMVCSVFTPFISYYLWMAIYGSAPGGVLGGLTRNEMIVYIFMTYITSEVVTIGVSGDITDDVYEGAVSMTLIKPIDYRMSLISRAIGTMLYRFVAPSVFVWIGLEIYKSAALGMGVTSPVNIVCYLISLCMSFFVYVLFDFCFGMMAFATTYMFGMKMAKNAILSFLSGQLIPISFFPEVLQQVFGFLPFSSMIYTPVMIYLGKYSGAALALELGRQMLWTVLLYAAGSLLWKQITKRLVVLGG